MLRFIPKMHDYKTQHPLQLYTCSITQYYLNTITIKQINSQNKMKIVYIVNLLQYDKIMCRSISKDFNNLSRNSKSPSSTTKSHGPFKLQALLTWTRLVSTSSLYSKHGSSHEGCPLFESHL